ncbi:S8 family serine peptidase [uncultured Sphingomonas sp.]|uniref:S8 family serine peptidase n=1 Tax=uncultured Sphingomonas sp. TaxID=158754 RepID=UPI00338DAA9B
MHHELQVLTTRRSFTVAVPTETTLQDLILSGSVAWWEAVVPLTPTVPGAGAEPDTSLTLTEDAPIVGVIDGGYRGSRYAKAVAWRQTPPLVSDHAAAGDHGNRVSSIVVDAHLWSNRLSLPQLQCRIGVVQAVPKPGSGIGLLDADIVSHVEEAFKAHPDTHIWNLSANIDKDCDDYDVSDLGRGLARISRENNKLLVVSAGNRNSAGSKIAPPADCEAALVVSGRINDKSGLVAGACAKLRVGYRPEGMLKPETSWFSRHRVVGGEVVQGTSFAAPLVSRLAVTLVTTSTILTRILLRPYYLSHAI